MRFNIQKGETYSPLYFLASLGAGGIVISFFMYLMFMAPHEGSPIPQWGHVLAAVTSNNVYLQALSVTAAIGIILFAIMHFYLLTMNIIAYSLFKKTDDFTALRNSNAEIQLMAIPLTLAMTVNVFLILGSLFVPGLWSIIDWLFPVAFLAFLSVGIYALKIFIGFLARVLTSGNFDCSRNNNLSQMLAIFAFTMVAVGFSAPAAMSQDLFMSGISLIFSIIFMSIAVLFAITKFILGFRSMFEHGIETDNAVSLWITIPILTLIGITLFRLSMATHHNFGTHNDAIDGLTLFTAIGGLQLMFGILGYVVMKHLGYFKKFVSGTAKSASSYALICPGVAAYVVSFFFVHQGLVATEMVEQFSIGYFVLFIPLVLLQMQTIRVLLKLNGKMISFRKQPPILVSKMVS
ncbi:MAG: hypothetical protein V3U78_00690 [Thiotrichaceae bacterium]